MNNITHRIKRYFSDTFRIAVGKNTNIYKKILLFYYYTKVSVANFLDGRVINLRSIKFMSFNIYFDSISELNMLVGEIFVHEPYYFKSIKNDPVIYDCGGNIGVSVLYFKYLYPDAIIKVFEPSPRVFTLLQKNMNVNNLRNVSVYNVALSDSEGNIDLFVKKEMSLATTVSEKERQDGKRVSVKKDRLSKYINKEVDLLKLDVQLSEGAIFNDLGTSNNTLRQVNRTIMEFHYSFFEKNNNLSDIIKNFEKYNFFYKIELNAEKPNGFKTYIINAIKK